MEVSSWTWDYETGTSMTPVTESFWDDYIKRHPEAKPSQNKGWPHFVHVSMILPGGTTGANVFFPTICVVPEPHSQGSQDEASQDPASSDSIDGQEDDQNDNEVCISFP